MELASETAAKQSALQRLKAWSKKNQGAAILLGIIAALFIIPMVLALWFILIPGAAAWYVWKKTSFPKRTKLGIVAAAAILAVGLGTFSAYANRAPSITITSPEDGISLQERRVDVTGTVTPKDSEVTVNGIAATVHPDGTFTGVSLLKSEQNTVTVEAKNGSKTSAASLSIARIFTEDEKAELAAAAEKARQEQAAKEAEEKAAQATYERSPAGRACKANPTWSKEDCQNLMDGKIWIGMEYDMLVYRLGKPDHANLSNYGRGARYQYCWTDKNPSCFYDNDSDGLIDSYN